MEIIDTDWSRGRIETTTSVSVRKDTARRSEPANKKLIVSSLLKGGVIVGGTGDGVIAVGSAGRKGVRVGVLPEGNSKVVVGFCGRESELAGVETGKLQLLAKTRTSQAIIPTARLY